MNRLALILLCALLVACDNQSASEQTTAPAAIEKQPVQAETKLANKPANNNIKALSIPAPWGVAARALAVGSLVAGVSHSDNYLAIWQIAANRDIEEKAKAEIGFHSDSVHWIDWNQDGVSDELIVTAEGRSNIELWRYNNGELAQLGIIPAEDAPQTVNVADLDQDGVLDLVTGPYRGERVALFWGQDALQFETAFLAAGKDPVYPKLVDWNRDGRIDIAWSDWQSDTLRWAENQGDRQFVVHLIQEKIKSRPRETIVGHINADNNPDLLVALELGKAALILYGDGNGGIMRSERVPALNNGYATGAIHRDAQTIMLALAEWDNIIVARRADSDTDWKYWQIKTQGSIPQAMQFHDVDKDGQIDLVFANSAGQQIEIHYGPIWEHMQPIELSLSN